MTIDRVYEILTKQVANSEQQEKIMESEAVSIQKKLRDCADNPNMIEIYEEELRKVDKEIHECRVDKNKLEKTEK